MNYKFLAIILFFWGSLLGIIFFGGLWLTVKKGLDSKYPGLMFSISLVSRLAVVLSGFYFAMKGFGLKQPGEPLYNIVSALTGFLVSRFLILKFSKKENNHETFSR